MVIFFVTVADIDYCSFMLYIKVSTGWDSFYSLISRWFLSHGQWEVVDRLMATIIIRAGTSSCLVIYMIWYDITRKWTNYSIDLTKLKTRNALIVISDVSFCYCSVGRGMEICRKQCTVHILTIWSVQFCNGLMFLFLLGSFSHVCL